MHVDLHHHAQVIFGLAHHLLDDKAHETHPVVEAAAELVVTVVGVRREKLADQVAMTRMDLHTVEPRLTSQVHGMAEVLHQPVDLLFAQLADKGRRIEVKASRGAHGGATASGAVCHVATMSQLDGGFGTFGMDGIRQLLQLRHNLLAHPQLPVERKSRTVHRGVGHRGHAHAATGHRQVIVEQILRRPVAIGHILKSRRADQPVAQRDGANLTRSEYL